VTYYDIYDLGFAMCVLYQTLIGNRSDVITTTTIRV